MTQMMQEQQPRPGAAPDQAVLVLADDFRQSTALAAAILIRSVIAAWRQIDIRAVRQSWPPLQTLISALVRSQYGALWRDGAAFYAQARALSAAGGAAPSLAAPPALVSELVTRTLNTTGPGAMLHAIKGGQQVQQALENAAVQLAGASARLALGGARGAVLELVKSDPEALGWMRVLGPQPCAFCAMLASRGPVYKSAESAGFEAHNHCMCSAVPVFTRQQAAASGWGLLAQEWKQVTKGLSGRDARNAWRRHWDSREVQAPSIAA